MDWALVTFRFGCILIQVAFGPAEDEVLSEFLERLEADARDLNVKITATSRESTTPPTVSNTEQLPADPKTWIEKLLRDSAEIAAALEF